MVAPSRRRQANLGHFIPKTPAKTSTSNRFRPLSMADEEFWDEVAAKAVSETATPAVDRPCAAVDFPPLLPKGHGEFAVVAIAAVEDGRLDADMFATSFVGYGRETFVAECFVK